MNKHIKNFLIRGMLFAGFGPIILGIIYMFLQINLPDLSLSGKEICLGIVSTYLLAFLQAGASVFNSIEDWPLAKSTFFHFLTIYIAYTLCYLVNTWIPFEPKILLFFTLIFIGVYLIVWLTVFITIKVTAKKFNKKLES